MHGTGPDLKAFDQVSRIGDLPVQSPAAAAWARVKVLNPLTSIGPSIEGELLSSSDSSLAVRVPRCVFVGSMVQVRTRERVVFGHVWSSVPAGAEFEIGIAVRRSL
jgi:hypothetical protein